MFNLRYLSILSLVLLLLLSCQPENNSREKKFIAKKVAKKNVSYINSIFTTVKINGTIKGNFLLDTGSPVTLLDSNFVSDNAISLNRVGTTMVSGSGNSEGKELPIYENVSMTAFGDSVHSDVVLVYNLKKIIPVEDGIIGVDFFNEKLVEIDYESQNVTILKDSSALDKSYMKVELVVKNSKMYIPLSLHVNETDVISGLFLIDTGSEFGVSLDRFYVDSLKLYNKTEKKITKSVKNGGVGGDTFSFLIKAENIKLEEFVINGILVNCSKNSAGATAKKSKIRLGKVGNLFLQNFKVVIDKSNANLYLKKNSNYSKEFSYIRSGISIGKTDKGFIVKSVLTNSEADKNGLKPGDIILEINSKKTKKLGYYKTRELLQTSGVYKLKVIRGDQSLNVELEVLDLMHKL